MFGGSSPGPQGFDLTVPFCKLSLAQSTFAQTGHHQWANLQAAIPVFWQPSAIQAPLAHMGHFPQDGENEQNLSFFFYFWSFTVTKRFDFFKFSQLFWRDYVRCSLKILSFTLQKFFGVPCSTPVFALLSDFWVKIRALVRPNRQRWTGFDLLIIFLVKFWWFSFFLEPR